ncbi:uncharacterized protein LOC122057888 [Macadamia integrifolia]|uniref:uncharacterized protein LOC122057888 n=1 Tax=Macadamia integrifolia TaxID=60698 RepID=UPI001C5281D5|nr:uncharacterized protein LOC122057888 [Macadamia integrifolia]
MWDDDDDFQNPGQVLSLVQKNPIISSLQKTSINPISQPLRPSNGTRSSRKTKRSTGAGKENSKSSSSVNEKRDSGVEKGSGLTSTKSGLLESNADFSRNCRSGIDSSFRAEASISVNAISVERNEGKRFEMEASCLLNLNSSKNGCSTSTVDNEVSAFDSAESQLLDPVTSCSCRAEDEFVGGDGVSTGCDDKGLRLENGYLSNSVESRLLVSRVESNSLADDSSFEDNDVDDFEPGTQLNVLMKLCSEIDEIEKSNGTDSWKGDGSGDSLVECPLCGIDISGLGEEQKHAHTNGCLDREEEQHVQTTNCFHSDEIQKAKVVPPCSDTRVQSPMRDVDVSPVLEWLRCLGLSRYDEAFVREEIDWDTLHWLTEEDLFSMGVTALGPRKKIVNALTELRKGSTRTEDIQTSMDDASRVKVNRNCKLSGNKLITEYFLGSSVDRKRDCAPSVARGLGESKTGSVHKWVVGRSHVRNEKLKDTPSWCCIPGTPFRVDAFRYLRGNCSHWFLTHFHIDHYQGLTRSFCHGKIYCSSITARLVNFKIGIPWDRLQVLPLNQKITIANVDVTCFDANHCPGSIIILFEPPNGKAVLHTGDFRFNEDMKSICVLQSCPIHTLILDTTYCNTQYDFPKQEAVIQFVIEAIQAEAFNPKTLFLIGSYTIGKERLFLEVARVLHKKVYVGAAKLRLLECLGLPEADMQWFTKNEQESHIHVVPMWTIASFKRMKHLSSQYSVGVQFPTFKGNVKQ